jgi:hypothetical protein
LQEQKSENKKQRKVINELASRNEKKECEAETARNKETLKKSGVATKKKKKTKGVEAEDQEKAQKNKETTPKKKKTKTKKPVEDEGDVLETCLIKKHTTDKQGEVKVKVKWGDSGNQDWQCLYDMWADYPTEVMAYKKKNHKSTRGKTWKVPNIDDVEYFVRILGMIGGDANVEEATFFVLANNGYKFDGEDCVRYDELLKDDPDLLQAFLVFPEADDVTIA